MNILLNMGEFLKICIILKILQFIYEFFSFD